MVDESAKGYFYSKIENDRTNTDLLLYGVKIEGGYLFINTPLAPVAATTNILIRQLFIITNILIVMGCAISMIAATTISKPINRITSMASKLANGDYDVEFNSKAYYEAQELAETLNFAAAQIAKIDTQQRDLIANVSHDLRTPLTMVKAYAEMVRDLSGENPVKRNEHLNIIIEETDRLALLVSDMLDLSKLENGGLELNYSEFPISETLNEIVEHYKGLESGLNISFESDEEVIVNCDKSKIKQVIYNLINNAVNYTGDDKCVYVKQINTEDGVRIEVRDTGSGISKDDLDLIFDKYYRSENHKRTTIGTGLGLSIVKAILKKHKYPYGVISTLNVGTTFWFLLFRESPHT
jgi:signal transduction histidine kinase